MWDGDDSRAVQQDETGIFVMVYAVLLMSQLQCIFDFCPAQQLMSMFHVAVIVDILPSSRPMRSKSGVLESP